MIRHRSRIVFAILCGMVSMAVTGGCANKDNQPPSGAAAQSAIAAQSAPQNVPANQSAVIQARIAESKARNAQALQQRDQSPHHP